MANYTPAYFYGLNNPERFFNGIQEAINSIENQDGIYTGDNLFTYGRNLGFLDDKAFVNAVGKNIKEGSEGSALWRMSVVLWGVRNGLRLEGDFVECACYKGTTARVICDTVDFKKYKDRHYYLYDLFEYNSSFTHHSMSEHGKDLFQKVKDRFSDLNNVIVTQGKVPNILEKIAPEKIAFMHIDLNSVEAEIGALEILFDRMVPGAILVLDDYGWLGYRAQKLAEDPWFEKRGYNVLEIPTGQGLVIKQGWSK